MSAKLIGDAVILRPLTRRDLKEYQRVRKRNARHLKPWLPTWRRGGPPKYSIEAYEAKLKRARNGRRGRSMFTFGVFRRTDRAFIGEANLGHIFYWPVKTGEAGWWIDEAHQGQGLMTEAFRLLLDYAFNDLGLHRVQLTTTPSNRRARRLAERVGFRREGLLKRATHINGKWEDSVLYGLLAEEHSAAARRRN